MPSRAASAARCERAGDVVVVRRAAQGLERRAERVEHRLVARLGLAALDHALDARVERRP